MIIRRLTAAHIPNALILVKNVFHVYEAPDYSDEGMKAFYNFLMPERICQEMNSGDLKLWGAFESEKIVGVIATRNMNHIALFFVDAEHHRRGIGRKL